MQDPKVIEFLKGFAASQKRVKDKKREAEEWFKRSYPGIIPNWKDYGKAKKEDKV